MTFMVSLLFSLIQAATEFLPISSSGHLLFLKGLLRLTELPVVMDVVLHLGSLLAIFVVFWNPIWKILRLSLSSIAHPVKERESLRFPAYIVLSSILTAALYLFGKKTIDPFFNEPLILPYSFAFTGVCLFFTRLVRVGTGSPVVRIGWHFPVLVGLFQGIAILPGVSRSGATISMARILGARQEEAGFYSFFLAIPAILGALFMQIGELENVSFIRDNLSVLLVAFIFSAVASTLFLRLLITLLKRGKLWLFSFYAFGMACISWIFFH